MSGHCQRGSTGAGNPQRQLWCAVLLAAVDDAVTGPPSLEGTPTPAAKAHAWRRARDYVLTPNRDFADVCHLAGLDPVAVRERVAAQCLAHPLPPLPVRETKPAPAPKPKPKPAPKATTHHPRTVFLTHKGLTLSVREWSARTGIKPATIRFRLARGHTVAEALTTPTQETALTHDGLTLSVSAWARRTGLPLTTIRGRLERGQSAAEALTTPKREVPTLTLDGETMGLPDWSARTGLPLRTIHDRMTKGWSAERILTQPMRPARPRKGSGAGQDFPPSEGTGGGRHAQDMQKLEMPA